MLRNNSFIGVHDDTSCLVQYGTKLLLLDYTYLSKEMFFQISIRRFGCMSKIVLDRSISVVEFVLAALDRYLSIYLSIYLSNCISSTG
jgi:hypothetical protein